jgi:hypothetical protein
MKPGKPFASQPPSYVGHRRTRSVEGQSRVGRSRGRNVTQDPTDDELDALFIRAMAEDDYARSLLQHFLDRDDEL